MKINHGMKIDTKKLAPSSFKCFNRPKHTLKTLESLSNNNLAKFSDLYIFCDNAKEGTADISNINEVKKIVKSKKKWCKNVYIEEFKNNYGQVDAFEYAIKKIVNKYGKIIVLEDDQITSKGFLTYLNKALNIYENDKKSNAYQRIPLPC